MRTQRQLEAIEELKQWITKYNVVFGSDTEYAAVYAFLDGNDDLKSRAISLDRYTLFKDETGLTI